MGMQPGDAKRSDLRISIIQKKSDTGRKQNISRCIKFSRMVQNI